MMDHAIVAGNFTDIKLVKTRSVVQIIIEVPVEASSQALMALGGIPQPGHEKPVAIALLGVIEGMKEVAATRQIEAPEKPDLTLGQKAVQRAGILAGGPGEPDAKFEAWIMHMTGRAEPPHVIVRDLCGVKSRREFTTDAVALDKWHDLVGGFDVEMKYGDHQR